MTSSGSSLHITGLLISSFLENTFDYFKLFIPLLLVYKAYIYYHARHKISDGLLFKILDLFTFGSALNKQNVQLLPESVDSNNNTSEKSIQIKIVDLDNADDENSDKLTRNKIFSFLLCFGGLQVSFLLWGLMQERIVKYSYSELTSDLGTNEEILENRKKISNFKNSQFLVLSNRLAGLFLSSLILIMCNRKSIKLNGFRSFKIPLSSNSLNKIVSYKNWAPLFICSYASLSNVLSSWFQYESLKYVSFTSQLLAKSSKSVFVMLTGKVVSNKNYKLHEYVCVFIIGLGIFLFSDINKNDLNETNKIISTTFPGFLCLLGYLISDSFTSTWQDNLIKTYSMSSISLMFITNLYSCAYTLISLLSQDQLAETIDFMREHSDITNHIVLLSITSAIGQVFIFLTIQKFGALVFSLIMTTRQVLSILLSSIVFHHSMSIQNIFGILLIFFALFLQQFFKFNSRSKRVVPFTKI